MKTAISKVKVKEIYLNRLEGKSVYCNKPVIFKSYKEARSKLFDWGMNAPMEGEGYDKVNFKVTFEDGETYTGRLDIKHPSATNNDLDVSKHVRDHILFYCGDQKPYWMTKERYELSLQGVNTQEYKDFFNKYDLES